MIWKLGLYIELGRPPQSGIVSMTTLLYHYYGVRVHLRDCIGVDKPTPRIRTLSSFWGHVFRWVGATSQISLTLLEVHYTALPVYNYI